MKKIILLISLIAAVNINAQYPLAPEIWSIPKEVAIISEYTGRAESPSISFDGNKLYFHGISMTERADTGWKWPVRLNNNVNQHLVRNPCISPNGKRLFFTWFWPGWDLYYSDWDSTINDWGIAVNCGANVNDPYLAEIGCSLPNDTTLIFLRANTAYISYWNSQTETWGPVERWPTPTLWFQSDWGIYVSPSLHKVYDIGSRADTTISGEWYLN